jgi:hypothetical protein
VIEELSTAIEAAAAAALASSEAPKPREPTGIQPLRGTRGVPSGILAGLIAHAYRQRAPELPGEGPALDQLFGQAWEDGLAAIGLCATCVPANPHEALELGLAWAARTDDVVTADSLGWLVLGPAASLTDRLPEVVELLAEHPRAEVRRAGAAMALAFTPERIEGAAAAALREQVGERQVRMVAAVVPGLVGPICARFVRDDAPAVQKALRRAVRVWADDDPQSLIHWAAAVPGGIPRLLGAEVDRVKPPKKERR